MRRARVGALVAAAANATSAPTAAATTPVIAIVFFLGGYWRLAGLRRLGRLS